MSSGFGYCSIEPGAHCVGVYSNNYGETPWRGYIIYEYNIYRAFIDGRVFIELNDYYSIPGSNRNRKTTCHELGHALGIGHNTSQSSCKYHASNDIAPYPIADDYNLLQWVVYRS